MKNTRMTILAAILAGLTGVLAWVVIPLPFSPVPVSGQSLGVMLTGVLLVPKYALVSQLVYLLLGIVGIPVFSAGTSGIGILWGPTGGYLLSFPLASATISLGFHYGKENRTIQLMSLIIGGVVLVYGIGLTQLSLVMDIDYYQAFLVGGLPFLFGDAAKVILIWVLAPSLVRIIRPR